MIAGLTIAFTTVMLVGVVAFVAMARLRFPLRVPMQSSPLKLTKVSARSFHV